MIRCLVLLALTATAWGGRGNPAPAAAFKVAWEPLLPSRMQWFTATHVASGRKLPRLKCAWCVSDSWKKLDPAAAAKAREAWAQATAQAAYDRLVYAESAAGIKAAKLAEAEAAAVRARQAAEAIAVVAKEYPGEKLPTVRVIAATAVPAGEAPAEGEGGSGLLALVGAGTLAAGVGGASYLFGRRRATA
jgi:hypothetical protein